MATETAERLELLATRLRDREIDLLALVPSPTLRWLTGHAFGGYERLFALLLPARGEPVVILPSLEESHWRESVPAVDRLFTWEDADGPAAAVRAAVGALGSVERLAIEPLAMRCFELAALEAALPRVDVVTATAVIEPLRRQKNAAEVAAMERAVAIAEEALETALTEVQPGSRERQIAGRLSSLLLEGGGETLSFPPIVLSGPKSALPHGAPDDRELRAGELLLIDFGTSWQGYHCDITRTFVVGAEPEPRVREVYEAVRAGNRSGVAAVRPGATADEIQAAASRPLEGGAFSEFATYRVGHGLGLDVHEPPSLVAGNDEPLGEGTVITVEPGLYLEGWGGVRIEDDVLATGEGARELTTFDRSLRIVGG